MMNQNSPLVKYNIDKIETTDEILSGRAGLTLITRYLKSIGILNLLSKVFSFLKKNKKGSTLISIFNQIICFFFDGTSFHLNRFDDLKTDTGYAASIETALEDMLSSHSVKRFFKNITIVRVWLFRKVLHRLFLWRLSIEKPEVIKLGVDTMVMDNDEAERREGVEPTYKKVKGFQPLQMYWGRYLIDAIFRNGKAHSNHGNHVYRMVRAIVRLIRKNYSTSVPIVLLADSGFFDQKLIGLCEELGIGIIVGGKMYEDIKDYITGMPAGCFSEYRGNGNTWYYTEFGDRRSSWDRFMRVIYTKPIADDDGQVLLEFERPETLIYTNLGLNNEITKSILTLKGESKTHISPQAIIRAYHLRGRDELVNRGLKDFGSEQLPFIRFSSNAAYYYLMLISFFLFEAFKQDMGSDVISPVWYASTFRRRYLDIAGKIIRTGRQIILKVTAAIRRALYLDLLWERSSLSKPIELVT